MEAQDEPEEVDGEKITKAIAHTIRVTGNPWRVPGAQYQTDSTQEKATKSPKRSQGERQRARARAGTSASEGRPEEGKEEKQNQGPGQGQGQRKRNQTSKQTLMERVSTRRKGKRQWREGKRITSAVKSSFVSLVEGATETDLCLILDDGSWRNGAYTHDHGTKRCITCDSLFWPVAWVLGRLNLKTSPSVQASTRRIHQRAVHQSRAQSLVAVAPQQQSVLGRERALEDLQHACRGSTQDFPRRSSGFGF